MLAVLRREPGQPWPDAELQAAEERSVQARRPALGPVDGGTGQFTLVLASAPASFALRIDLQRMLPWDDWPIARGGPVRVALGHAGATLALQAGQPDSTRPAGLTEGFVFAQPLSVASQAFELRLQRATGPAEWPWPALAAWGLISALALAALAARQRGGRGQRRARELLRLGQVGRLNTLGELAAGMAHELNQPLTAVLASTQAAQRLLDDTDEGGPDLATTRQALAQSVQQARRAADVVARLRRLVQPVDGGGATRPLSLEDVVGSVVYLLMPQIHEQGVQIQLQGLANAPDVQADPVALEQIVHNLVLNALQALATVPPTRRRLVIGAEASRDSVVLSVHDSGPGFPPEALERSFEPFFTTRESGLGLGLSLCASLADGMGGGLVARNAADGGAELRLTLMRAAAAPAAVA